MSSDEFTLLWRLYQQMADSIKIINHELGGLQAQMKIVLWFIGINITIWVSAVVGIIVNTIWKKKRNKE